MGSVHVVREPSWEHCPLCGLAAQLQTPGYRNADGSPPQNNFRVACERCGQYGIAGSVGDYFDAWSIAAEERLWLSCATRQATDCGRRLVLQEDRLKRIANDHRNTSFSQIMMKALTHFARHSRPGEDVHVVQSRDYPLFDLSSATQVGYLLTQLVRRDLVEESGGGRFHLTARGWEAIEPVTSAGVIGLCFVAMSFDPSMTEAYEHGFLPAIETDCKLRSLRIDREHFTERICDKMISDLRKAQFIVADFSANRPNVYFEAGFALGLGRPVVWTCRKDDEKEIELEFDTQQYPHLYWSSADDLRVKLGDRIRALGLHAR